MEDFLFTYHYIMLEFLFGLYLFYGMTLWNLHRADRFWLRLILGFVCVLTLTGAASWAYLFWGQNVLGRSTIYIALFAATIAHVRLCFDEPFLTILFCCSVAYAAQNLCYKLYLTVACTAELLRFSGYSFPSMFTTVCSITAFMWRRRWCFTGCSSAGWQSLLPSAGWTGRCSRFRWWCY